MLGYSAFTNFQGLSLETASKRSERLLNGPIDFSQLQEQKQRSSLRRQVPVLLTDAGLPRGQAASPSAEGFLTASHGRSHKGPEQCQARSSNQALSLGTASHKHSRERIAGIRDLSTTA